MEKEKKKRKRKKKKVSQSKKIVLYVSFAIILLYIMYASYLLVKQPTNVFTIEEGKLYQEENIFRYYSTNEETLKKKIADLDNKIQEVMLNDKDLATSDMKLLENQIDEKVEDINQITDTAKLTEYKKEISSLVTKKAQIAGDLSPKGSYLNQLIEERKGYESQLNSGAEYVTAPMSGIVSYKVDGLEEVLTPDNFSALSKNYLESLELKTGKIVATSEESRKSN